MTDGPTLCRRLATLIPPRRSHVVRYHGVFASAHRLRDRVLPVPPDDDDDDATPVTASMLARRLDWAALLERVFDADVTTCPRCGAPPASSPSSQSPTSPPASSTTSPARRQPTTPSSPSPTSDPLRSRRLFACQRPRAPVARRLVGALTLGCVADPVPVVLPWLHPRACPRPRRPKPRMDSPIRPRDAARDERAERRPLARYPRDHPADPGRPAVLREPGQAADQGAKDFRYRLRPGVSFAGEAELARSPFLGALFEGWIAAEIVKTQTDAGRRRELYYFRDQQGLEVNFVVPGRGGAISLIEATASRTPRPGDAAPLQRLAAAFEARGHAPARLDRILVHRGKPTGTTALAPRVDALTIEELLRRI